MMDDRRHLSITLLIGMYAYLQGHGSLLLFTYFLPLRLSVLILAYTFDYIPHRPHGVTRGQDVYATTSRVDGVITHGDGKGKSLWLDIMLLYQVRK